MSLTPNPSKLYFKNLHGFRFFAAALVILTHLELFKKRAGLVNYWDNPFFFEAGAAGVDFFFVLSGFLITSLLLKEMENYGSIDLSKFYIRRILRIWPLYYLVLFLCYFLLPQIPLLQYPGYSEGIFQDFYAKFWLSFFFLPNAALAFYPNIPYAAPLWSVGVEEQFYLFWPVLLMLFPKKLKTYLIFIGSFIFIKALLVIINRFHVMDPVLFEKIKSFVVATRMECMGIGGLGAWLIYSRTKIGKVISSNLSLIIVFFTLPFIFIFAKRLFELHHIIFSICFLVIILNGATNPKTFINLENKVFLTLGNISYGLYLWHMIWIGMFLNILLIWKPFQGNELWFNITLYTGAFILSILWSWLSYTYFETLFLNIKKRFAVIVSGVDARN